jgi:hypothetical protein
VSLLALAQPSEAEIVYTPVHVNIGPNTKYNVDFGPHAAVPLFTIYNVFRITSNFCLGYLDALSGTGSMAGIVTSSLSNYLYALSRGARCNRTLSGSCGDGGDFPRGLVADVRFDPGHEFRHVARHHLPDTRSKLV